MTNVFLFSLIVFLFVNNYFEPLFSTNLEYIGYLIAYPYQTLIDQKRFHLLCGGYYGLTEKFLEEFTPWDILRQNHDL